MLTTGIKEVKFFEDGIIVKYHLQKPWGTPDVEAEKFISYESIKALFPLPEKVGVDVLNWQSEEIYVPKLNKTIVFIFDSFQERSGGPNEHNICGPYLKA